MKAERTIKRTVEVLAMTMIGDGVLAVIGPRRHVTLWKPRDGASWWNRMLRWFVQHRRATRAIGAVEIVAGVALAQRQWRTR